MDVLSEAVAAMRTGRPESFVSTVSSPWGLRFAARHGVAFHVMLSGACFLLADDSAPIRLGPGDVVLRPHGEAHGLADDPTTPMTNVVEHPDGQWSVNGPVGGGGPTTRILCGAYRVQQSRRHPLVSGLPAVVLVRAAAGANADIRAAVDMLGRELEQRGPGSEVLLAAVLDALFLLILRAGLAEQAQQASSGWAAALADPAISAALQAVHENPAAAHSVAGLAARANLSRAAFSARFTSMVGQPPMRYVTWWRMTVAARELTESDIPVARLAFDLGYASEAAFSRAFAREHGRPPGQYRRAPGAQA